MLTTRPCRFRFALNDGHVRALEDLGMRGGQAPIPLELRFAPEVQLIRWVANSFEKDPRAPELDIETNYGVLTHAATFMTATVHPLELQISRSHFVEHVLPGLGASSVRLIAVRLPSEGRAGPEVFRHFDKARAHLDAGRATEAIQACRAVRDAFQKAVAAEGRGLARTLAGRRGLDPERPGVAFVQEAWDALARLTDKASHPVAREFTISEARACVFATALLLEALSALTESS